MAGHGSNRIIFEDAIGALFPVVARVYIRALGSGGSAS